MPGTPAVFEMHRELFATALPTPWPHRESAAELASWLADEIAKNQLFSADESARKRVPQLLIFVSHCAPPGASEQALQLASGFLFAFFLLNDDFEQHGANFEDAAPSELSRGARFIRSWLDAFGERFGPRATRFLTAFERYRRSLGYERRLQQRPEPTTRGEYLDRERGRYQWVATAPYIELWEVAEDVRLEAHERARADELEALGVELTYLANDIGSLRRDASTANYVTLQAERDPALTSLPVQLDATGVDYATKVRAFIERSQSLRGELARYARLVSAITDGNLAATLVLARSGDAGRYAVEARDCLARLPRIGLG